MPPPAPASADYFEHTADIGVIGRGASVERAFEGVAGAMFAIMADPSRAGRGVEVQDVIRPGGPGKRLRRRGFPHTDLRYTAARPGAGSHYSDPGAGRRRADGHRWQSCSGSHATRKMSVGATAATAGSLIDPRR